MSARVPGAIVALAILGAPTAAAPAVPPEIKIEGKTDGSAQARASVGITLAGSPSRKNDPADDILRFTAQVATAGGLTNFVFSDSNATSTPSWSGGVTWTHAKFSWPSDIQGLLVQGYDEQRKVFAACAADCDGKLGDPGFCDLRAKRKGEAVDRWLQSLVLVGDLPSEFPAGHPLTTLSESLAAWNPTEAGTARWRQADSYCDPKRAEASKVYADLAAVLKSSADAALKIRVIGNAARQLAALLGQCVTACQTGVPSQKGLEFCTNEGGKGLSPEALKNMPTEVAEEDLAQWPKDKICPQYAKDFAKASSPPAASAFPQQVLNFGFSVGESKFTYLSPDGAGNATPKSGSRTPLAFGGTGEFILDSGPHATTLETLIVFSQTHKGGSTTVHWCTPSVNVVHDGRTDQGEVCKDQSLGAPEQTQGIELALQIGKMNGADPTFRAALGADVTLPLNATNALKWSGSISLPIYFVFASKDASLYKGLVRISPSVTHREAGAGGKSETAFVLSLALLGQRTVFSEQFDSL